MSARSQIDLHTHTTASDGNLSPGELVARAAQAGLRVLGVTDHDSTEGVLEAMRAAEPLGIEIVAGVEINTDVPQDEVHILGYFIHVQDSRLQAQLTESRHSRLDRGRAMVDRLRELGVPISWKRVQEIAGGGAVARPHVARALLEAGHVSSLEEAFAKYIGRNGPAYVERRRLSPAEAVGLIVESGGLAVLAHPWLYDRTQSYIKGLDLERILPGLCDAGLSGIEAYYLNYPAEATQKLLRFAERFDLVPTGGSDYHGHPNSHADLGSVYVPWEALERLKDRRDAAKI